MVVYDFYPTICVFSISEPLQRDKEETLSWTTAIHGRFFLSHVTIRFDYDKTVICDVTMISVWGFPSICELFFHIESTLPMNGHKIVLNSAPMPIEQ